MTRFFLLILILALIMGVFYFDKFSIIGSDVSFYLDISYLLSDGQKFLVDFFDYRVPVFPLLLSPIYKLGLSDFSNRFAVSLFLYSFYVFTIYFLSLFITKSVKKSALVALITFFSISSRQFDAGREIEVPLFYHTLELLSVFILLKAVWSEQAGQYSKLRHGAGLLLSGVLFGLAFIGRQVHILPPILILVYLLFRVYKKDDHLGKPALKLVLPFLAGLAATGALLFKFFYVPGHDLLSQARIWLFEMPRLFYIGSHPVLNIVRKILATLHTGLAELKNVYLPIFWFVYVSTIVYCYKNFIATDNGPWASLKKIYQENKTAIQLIVVSFVLTITTTMTTGFGGTNHQAPFFTLYALIFAFMLSNFKLKKHLKNRAFAAFLIIFALPNLYRFAREERVIMQKAYIQKSEANLPENITLALGKAGLVKNDQVLVLGAYPVVARLANYKPFAGYLSDVYLFSPWKIYGEQHLKYLDEKLREVNIAYKLPDYPNLDWIKEKMDNPVYLHIEKYIKNNFRIAGVVKNGGGLNEEVIIYKRKGLK